MAWYQTRNYPSSGIYPQYNTQLRYFTATPPVDTNTKNLRQSKKKNISARQKTTSKPPSTSPSSSSSTKTKDLKSVLKPKEKTPLKSKIKISKVSVDSPSPSKTTEKACPKKKKKVESITNQNNFL